jgi:nucleoside-diphosphate-sugar epimerase
VYNLSSDRAASTREIVAILARLFGRDLPVTYGEASLRVKIPNAKLRAAGWTPAYDLESGLRQTVQSHA